MQFMTVSTIFVAAFATALPAANSASSAAPKATDVAVDSHFLMAVPNQTLPVELIFGRVQEHRADSWKNAHCTLLAPLDLVVLL